MPKHVTISLLDGVKHTAADLADPTTTTANNLTISIGDNVLAKLEQVTGPASVALTNVRRAIEEGTNTAPAAVTLYGVKANTVDVPAGLLAIDADSVGITLGADVLPKSNSTQFRERVKNATDALFEGLV